MFVAGGLLVPTAGQAAGFFLAPRGVRPLAQAGAFVAGADDLHALSYNPAGLTQARRQLLIDFGLPIHTSTYTTEPLKAGGAGVSRVGRGLLLPSPTLAIAHDLGLKDYGLGFGLSLAADYPLLQTWTGATKQPLAPERYAAGSFAGTAMAKLALGVGYRPWRALALGASVHVLIGRFCSQTTISACDGVACVQPQNPSYDASVLLQTGGLVVPGAQLGLQLWPRRWLAVGLSWETGYHIAEPTRFAIRLPTAAIFSQAYLDPKEPTGRVQLRLPQVVRLGLEARRAESWRLELSAVFEPWHVHDAIDVQIDNAALRQVVGLGSYQIGNIGLRRGFVDTYSVRLGGEYAPRFAAFAAGRPLLVRAGVMYEPSAIPTDMLTAMTVDLDKLLVCAGGAWRFGRWQLELAFSQIFMGDRQVTHSRIYQTNPIRPSYAGITQVGNGHYHAAASLVGAGLRLAL